MTRPIRAFLAAESLVARGSGIGRVARLMAKVLADRTKDGELRARGLALSDTVAFQDLGIETRCVSGSRLRFALETHRAAVHHTHFLYDFAGMARAHPHWLPKRRPFLLWIHGIEIWEEARRDRVRIAHASDVLVANTEYTRERAQRLRGGLARARVCWLGTERDDIPEISADHAGPPTVLILARIDTGGGYKGHRNLIEAWPAVTSAVPDARLLIAGSGPGSATLAEWVQSSPARAQIELCGHVPERELDALWSRATVLAMPGRGEGFGLVYIEAMRHGVPVLASIHDAAPEINLDSVTGYNVDLGNPGELTDRLVQLVRDREHARALGQAGQARWRQHYTYSAFSRRFSVILDELLAQ